jgi:hypothetical protein
MVIDFKVVPVEAVQPVVRADPDIALTILINTVDMAVREPVLDSVEFICICVELGMR